MLLYENVMKHIIYDKDQVCDKAKQIVCVCQAR